MSGGQAMVVLIVLITVIGSIFKNRGRAGRHRVDAFPSVDPDAARLREEVRALTDRIQVLERVITDTHSRHDLDREIEQLRHRR